MAGKWKVLFFCILVFLYSSIFAIIQFSSFFFALPDYGTCKKLGMCPDVLGDRQQKGRTSLSITNPDFLLPRQGKTLDRPAPMGHRRGPVIHESDHSVPLLVIGNPIPPLRLWPSSLVRGCLRDCTARSFNKQSHSCPWLWRWVVPCLERRRFAVTISPCDLRPVRVLEFDITVARSCSTRCTTRASPPSHLVSIHLCRVL